MVQKAETNSKNTVQNLLGVQELLEHTDPLPLVAPFVSGTPCVTPMMAGVIVSDTMILEARWDGWKRTHSFLLAEANYTSRG